MTVVYEFPQLTGAWTAEHWLHHCEGYRVDTPDGPIGFVETVLFSEENEPEAIGVRSGLFQTRLVLVSIDEVEELRPDWEVVVLRSVPEA